MITNELNTGLVNAVREKLPSKDNLANALMDILYIGKEAIYRAAPGRSTLHPGRSSRYIPETGYIAG